jgi:hypothetical protein
VEDGTFVGIDGGAADDDFDEQDEYDYFNILSSLSLSSHYLFIVK